MRWVFDKFLVVSVAALAGKRIQAAWSYAQAHYEEIDELTYTTTMLLNHSKMSYDWEHLVIGIRSGDVRVCETLAVLAYSDFLAFLAIWSYCLLSDFT